MTSFIQNIETGKVGKFIASIPTQGQGLLHLVEDVETGFVSAFPTLEKYRVAAQSVIDDIAEGVNVISEATASDLAKQEAPQVATGDPSAPVTSDPVPTNLAGTGVQAQPAAPTEPVADPNLPPLGA